MRKEAFFLLFIMFFTLFSCDFFYGKKHTFIDMKVLDKQQAKWEANDLKDYSFDFGMVFLIPGYNYSFTITIKNGLLVSKKYMRFGKRDVSELTDSEIEEKIQQVKDGLGDEYDNSYDKMCIEL